jgi:hypothetical protein
VLGTLFVMLPNRQRKALAKTVRQAQKHAA